MNEHDAMREDVVFFEVDSADLANTPELRIDAGHYSPWIAAAMERLRDTGFKLAPLGDVTERVFFPPRFKRVYVSSDFGVPFLQATHVPHLEPAGLQYLSRAVHDNLAALEIKKNWILITRSGTVGRVVLVPAAWDGWAASEHNVRVVPTQGGVCPPGYLAEYLKSFPAQAQLRSNQHGAVVDEISEDQVRSVLVPLPKTEAHRATVNQIDEFALNAARYRDLTVDLSRSCTRASEAIWGEVPVEFNTP